MDRGWAPDLARFDQGSTGATEPAHRFQTRPSELSAVAAAGAVGTRQRPASASNVERRGRPEAPGEPVTAPAIPRRRQPANGRVLIVARIVV